MFMQEHPLRRSPAPFEVPAAVHNGRAFMKEGAEVPSTKAAAESTCL